MSSGSSSSKLGFLLVVAAVAIGVGMFFFLRGDGGNPNGGNDPADVDGGNGNPKQGDGDNTSAPKLTGDDYAGCYEFANIGVGHLENQRFLDAEATFKALRSKLPKELLPLQNLAITQTMRVVEDNSELVKDKAKGQVEAYENAVSVARETLSQLAEARPALAKMLDGLIAVKEGDTEAGIVKLHEAAQLDKDNPAFWFTLYKAHANLTLKPGEPLRPLALEAIEKAYELAPENLHAIAELMRTQAVLKNDKLKETLSAAKEVVGPLVASIKLRTRADLLDMFDKAIKDLNDGGNRGWVYARQIANLLKPDIAKRIDQRNIDRALLEYVVVEYGPDFDKQADGAGFKVAVEDPIQVIFKPAAPGLPEMTGVTDLQFADMNLDGLPDITVVQNGEVQIYGQEAEGKTWKQIASFKPDDGFSVSKVTLADLDRDYEQTAWREKVYRVVHNGVGLPADEVPEGVVFTDTDLDIVAYGESGAIVLRNDRATEGKGISFDRKLESVAVADEKFAAMSGIRDAVATDIDHDGDLDIVLAATNRLSFWTNGSTRGNIRLTNSDENIGPIPTDHTVRAIAAVDWNRDIANDIVVVTDKSVGLMQNVLHSRFRWRDMGTSQATGTSVAVGELNGDAVWDLVVGGENGCQVHLASPATDEGTGWLKGRNLDQSAGAVCVFDYDNDGYQDIVLGGEKLVVYRGLPRGQFEAASVLDAEINNVSVLDTSDIDLDGDEDLAVVADGKPMVLLNEGGNQNNWFRLTIRADPNPEQFPSNRVSMHGFGSVVELKSGARYQAKLVSGQTTLFGLGSRKQADILRIILTDGVPQNIVDQPLPESSLTVFAPQHLAGSCPYIYTWNGEKFTFYSDCLWAAPLGLQQAEGVFAPAREWEYIRIDGNSLQAKDGQYVLKMTEELWEATYLDEVKLIAVDHPVGTQIYSNEKVGPPNVTEFKVHGVKEPKLPVAAKDKHDRDLLPLLRAKDKQYVRAFDGRIKQGLTDEHFIELDLGKVEHPDDVTLFLVGWVFPTDTNINIGIDQTGEAPPKPPSIQVVDENGDWVDAVPFAGFPGGKTKTIAIDLSGAFKTDDYRVRLVTSMELYWDAAFFTDGKQSVETRQTELPLVSADLRYRGFSKRQYGGSVFSPDGFGPEDYDYYDVTTRPTWLPMDGKFTRYGDVLPLLTSRDDLQVVFGAGDEVTLTFDAAKSPVPEGYVRDFLLYNVGWDKDVKQNTVYGSTVEPLPYKGMKSYTAADSAFPDTEKHREFLRTWQTRQQNFRVFRNWVREFDTSGRKSSQ